MGGERLGLQGVQVTPTGGTPRLPTGLTGMSWLVADAGTGDVLAAYNPHLRLPPASTLKMLFADTVLPKFDRSAVHRVAPSDLAGLGAGSSLVGVKEDLDYKVEDLWRGVFLSSGNDAVHVLANMNGGIEQTVRQMQERAAVLGAADTHVVSPDGYDEDGQLTSAYDLTLFARDGLRNADFRSYCATRDAQFPGAPDKNGQRGTFGIQNTDRLLGKYPGLLGVKNGYTTNAGSTFVGAAERDGRTLLVAVMHPATYMKVYDETAALLDWGFAAEDKVAPVGVLVSPKEAASVPATAAPSSATPSSAPPSAAPSASAAAAAPPAKSKIVGKLPPAGSPRLLGSGYGLGGWPTVAATALACALAAGGWLATRRRRARRPAAFGRGSGSATALGTVGPGPADPPGATAIGRRDHG
ncbi:D-alanyl-D-alanine carboxypeptidase [Kitasatospora sp. MAP12-44]|uniref:D-alanyl-D-alanine carboxypeptidase family protein n=1 Tax=Kitasatospora sp. MAP12-44 TaxID=3035099 RepID=UPI002474A9B9|nr:D-alanyl-D-alanine carboxypeptidase [Kitasatospora sp. MAP12-44]